MSSIVSFKDIDIYQDYEPTCSHSSHTSFLNWAENKNINQVATIDPMQDIPKNLKNYRVNYMYKNSETNIPSYLKHARAFRCKETKTIWFTYQPTQHKCAIEEEIYI